MKNKLLSNGLAVVSLITAGLALTTNAKLQAHGHQHGDVFGRIMHQTKASSGSSLKITTIGAADCKPHHCPSGVAVLIHPPDFVAVLPTATGVARGPDCFDGDYDPTNATNYSNPCTRPTPVPQLQLQALEVQDSQSASLPSRRRNRYRTLRTSGKDEAAPIAELGPVSTGTTFAKTRGTYWLTYR